MKTFILTLLVLSTTLVADLSMSLPINTSEATLPVEKPIRPIRPIYPVLPIVNTGVVHQDNHYTTNYTSNCQQYIDTLIQKDEEILALKNELQKLQNQEQKKFSKTLKKSYDEELKAFENRKSSIKTKSSVTISSEPVQ